MKRLFGILACVAPSIALAGPPPAPVISVGVTDVRQLEFNWVVVPAVQTYELWYRSAPGAPWAKYAEKDARNSPIFRIGVPVHLLNWSQALFHVKACNPVDGCTASNNVTVNHLKVDAIGFIKPREASGQRLFGQHVALSADGKTLAVTANERAGTAADKLFVHVYRKTTATSGWRLETRLLVSTELSPGGNDAFSSDTVALSADGNVLVVGASDDASGSEPLLAGAAYVFRRTGTTWQQTQRIAGSRERDSFGSEVKIDDAGRTLVIRHDGSDAYNIGGYLEVFRSSAPGQPFIHALTLPSIAPAFEGDYAGCGAPGLSGDGKTLLHSCGNANGIHLYAHTGPDYSQTTRIDTEYGGGGIELSYDGTQALLQDYQQAHAWILGPDGWRPDGFLLDGEGAHDYGGRHIALSRDGKIAAVANYGERRVGLGPLYPPYQLGSQESANGGVMIWQRKATGWEFRRLVKPGSSNVGWAGIAVSLGQNGNVLAVGALLDPSAATGIDGDRDDDSAPSRGAVWLY